VYKSLCLCKSGYRFPIFFMISVSSVPSRFLGNPNWDAASWIRSYEWVFRSRFCQLICRFISNNALMPWHLYQLNPVMSGQLRVGLVAFQDQFWGDLVFVKCFDYCLTVKQNIDVSIPVVPIYILICACFNDKHFCLEYCRVVPKAAT
jgi:hypothetical protein